MKKFVLFTIIGILIATSAYSQDKQELEQMLNSLYEARQEFYEEENYAEAIRLGTEAVEVCKKLYGRESEDYVESINILAIYNARTYKYDEAIKLGTEALEIRKQISGEDNPSYATLLSNLTNYYSEMSNYAEAVRLGTEALEIYEKTYGKESLDYANSLSNLAIYNDELGNYEEAIRLSAEALEIRGRVLGKENFTYANSLNSMALYNSEVGNYTEAVRLGTEVSKIVEYVLGKESSDYASSLINLASYNGGLGNYAEAIRLCTKALEIQERVVGQESPDCALSLNNLGSYNSYLGNYVEAIRLGTEALVIYEKTYGKESPNYAISLSNIANCFSDLGNYAEAVRMGAEALEIYEKIYGKEHPIYATLLSNVAEYDFHLDNYAEAIRLGSEALEIRGRVLGKEHPDYALSLNNLACCKSKVGNYAEAIRLGTEALEIRGRVLGKEHPDYAASLHNLAKYNDDLGKYAEAVRLGTEALEIRGRVLGKEHPDYAASLSNMAFYNVHLGNFSEVCNCVMESSHLQSQLTLTTFSDLTSGGRALFWDIHKDWFEEYLPQFSYYIHNDSLTIVSYDGALLSKGLLLNTEIEMNKLLQESGDPVVVAKYEDLRANRAILNKLYEKPIAERSIDTDSLEKVIQSQERELVQLSKTYGDYTKNLSIDWHDVQEKLGRDDVAIEFLSFPVKNDSIMYVALTLTKDDDVPHMTSLFEKKELDDVDNTAYYKTTDVSQLVWKPLSDVMEGKENVYFAPAGELHNIAIESIPFYGGDELVSDKWNMYRLSSTRSLALIKDKNDLKRADVYGGLDYTTDSLTLVKNSMKYGKRSIDFTPSSNTIALADSLKLRAGVNNLPGTKVEASNVDRALEAMKLDTQLYTDTIGTEASFKALSGQRPNVLHIATHGFYWTESEAKDMSYLGAMAMFNDDTRPRYVEDKALTRSGLFFAGANRALKGGVLPEDVDDGILTAKEISTLDLRGLDLVVLSACQTGLGEITGDGVFGLQRGFKKAGANTIMMSLWKVDDDATQMLMSKFYHNLLLGENKKDALMKAQEYLRTVEDGKYSDPQYWAAFILLDAID